MALQGTLDTFALPDVLRLLAATKKSGRLGITSDRGAGSIWVNSGGISGVEAAHAPHATEPVDALFELLRFQEGSFAFDADAAGDRDGPEADVEALLEAAEVLLAEWREIESVVPSLDAYVTLRRHLAGPDVTVGQEQWTTLAAVGGGATVRRIGDELGLPEIPVSRAVRDLAELGIIDIVATAPAGTADSPGPGAVAAPPTASPSVVVEEVQPEPVVEPEPPTALEPVVAPEPPPALEPVVEPAAAEPVPEAPAIPELDPAESLPVARPLRARKKAPKVVDEGPREPERFVPLELPGHQVSPAVVAATMADVEPAAADVTGEVDPAIADLAAAFPGLANHTASPDEEELARQLAMLSPRAAEAVRAAAEAATDEEREAALEEVEEAEDAPINRGLLLKFLSSVKG